MNEIIHKSPYGGEYRLSPQFGTYQNGQTEIRLWDLSDGMPYATATVCVEDNLLKEDEVAIKDYSENVGILQALLDAGVVDHPRAFIQSGFVKIPICKLLTKNA